MPLDMLAPSFLLEQDIHRRRRYPYIYYCPSCGRGCLEKEVQEKCRFCGGDLLLTQGGKKYIYFCQHCDKRIEEDEPRMACGTCGNKINTIYRWDMLDRKEKRRIKLARMMKSFSGSIGKIGSRKQKDTAAENQAMGKKQIIKEQNEKIKGEELPSDEISFP